MSRTPFKVESRPTAFLNAHPEWADLAYQTLFCQGESGQRDVQYNVAQALMAAFEMGQRGFYPPRPKHLDPRLSTEPEPDPEMDAVYEEIRHLAWSPMAGTPKPEGHVIWAMNRYLERKNALSAGRAKLVTRTRPVAPPAAIRLVRRTRT